MRTISKPALLLTALILATWAQPGARAADGETGQGAAGTEASFVESNATVEASAPVKAASRFFAPGTGAKFAVPAGITHISIRAWAGGGGGGGSCAGYPGGAGAGFWKAASYTVTPGEVLAIQTQTGGPGGCGGGGGGAGGSVWVSGPAVSFFAQGGNGGDGDGGGCYGACGGNGGDSSVTISW